MFDEGEDEAEEIAKIAGRRLGFPLAKEFWKQLNSKWEFDKPLTSNLVGLMAAIDYTKDFSTSQASKVVDFFRERFPHDFDHHNGTELRVALLETLFQNGARLEVIGVFGVELDTTPDEWRQLVDRVADGLDECRFRMLEEMVAGTE